MPTDCLNACLCSGTVASLAPSTTSVWVASPVSQWSGMRSTQPGDKRCCCCTLWPTRWGYASKGAHILVCLLAIKSTVLVCFTVLVGFEVIIITVFLYILIVNMKLNSNLSSCFRYRLVPYGNHSYLESLTDKSKVRFALLLGLAYHCCSPPSRLHTTHPFFLSCVGSGTSSVLFWWPEVLLGQ